VLVLSRKKDETVVIGADGRVTITVLQVFPDGRVKLGVEAPKDVSVYRGEVYDRDRAAAAPEGGAAGA